MDYEVDLTPYIRAVLKYWIWIVSAGILFALLGFLYATSKTDTYEATALVTISRDRLNLRFDDKAETVEDRLHVSTGYEVLALSDGVLQPVADLIGEDIDITRLKMEAELSDDRTVLQLTTVSTSADEAAEMANSWATAFTSQMGQVFGFQGADQAQFFVTQLEQAQQTLAEAEANLITPNGKDTVIVLHNQLNTLTSTHAANLQRQNEVERLVQEVTSWQTEANSLDSTMLMLLQVQMLSLNKNAGIQLQLDTNNASTQTTAEKEAQLAALVQVLDSYADQLIGSQAILEADIQTVQQDFETARLARQQAERAFLIAEETHLTLSRKVMEVKLTQADAPNPVRVASLATPPTRSEGRGRVTATMLFGMIGGVLALIGALLTPVWHNIKQEG